MKKKIEDLTLKEIREIKHRCGNYGSCEKCREYDNVCYIICDVDILGLDDEILEQEIEVEENE